MGNTTSSSLSSCKHLALLGDSTIDNGNWTGGGPCVLDQVRDLLPKTTLCAKDGALISAIVQQAAEAPAHTTHFVVSVGGNDGLSGVNVMNQRAVTVADGMEAVFVFTKEFEEEYSQAIEHLIQQVGPDKHIVLCSVYNPCFGPFGVTTLSQDAANASVALLADAVVRVATRLHLPVIDWRRVMTQLEDFANPIEPSSVGGHKMAETVVMVVKQHSFSSQVSVVYPQQWPESEITSLPHQDLAPQGQARDTPVTLPLSSPSPSSLLPEAAVGTPTGTQEQHPSFVSSVSSTDNDDDRRSSDCSLAPPVVSVTTTNVLDNPASAAIVHDIRTSSSMCHLLSNDIS